MSSRHTRRLTTGILTFATMAAVGFGCSDDDDGNRITSGGSSGSNAGGNGGSAASTGGTIAAGGVGAAGSSASGGTVATGGSTASGGSTATGGSSGTSSTTTACPGLPMPDGTDTDGGAGATGDSGATCTGVASEAEPADLDMYIMMDRSVSMNCPVTGSTGTCEPNPNSRWQGVKDAVQAFVSDPRAANLGVGIQFFGASGYQDDAIDCDVTRYSTPKVEIADLSTNGPAIFQAVETTTPGGITPMAPALDGAVRHAKEWAAAHFGKGTIAVLVTDGFPTQCEPRSVSEIANIARQAYETEPRIRTFVIGLAAGLNLDAIARAGGTGNAFIIGEGDVRQQFLDAMLNFTSGAIVCEFEIPAPPANQVIDYNKVQVVYTPAVGGAEEVPKVDNVSQCATSTAGGWYYDNNAAPTKILVCPCTCNRFAAGRVDVRLGCAPRLPPVG